MPNLNVLNRYSEPIEIQFDAANNPDSPYRWEPGEVKSLPSEAAMFCRRRSTVREDPITGVQTRALVVQGIDKDYEDWALKSAALLPPRGPELLDRENMDDAAKAITYVSLKNPVMSPLEKESVAAQPHARRVP